jgi:hypothetical protein
MCASRVLQTDVAAVSEERPLSDVSANPAFGAVFNYQTAQQLVHGGLCAVRVEIRRSDGSDDTETVQHGVVMSITDGSGATVQNTLLSSDRQFLAAVQPRGGAPSQGGQRLYFRVILVPTRQQLSAVCACQRVASCTAGADSNAVDYFVLCKAVATSVHWPCTVGVSERARTHPSEQDRLFYAHWKVLA